MISKLAIAKVARKLSGGTVFRKRLPSEFGGARVNVTSRSDIRLLAPGFARSSSDLMQVASRYVKEGSCVWDIGSNLGIFSFCASWKAGPQGRVFTLEADPYYAELQNRTVLSLPKGYSPVTPLCAAVADEMGILDLCIPKRGHSRNHLMKVEGNEAGETESKKQVVSLTADFLLHYWPMPDLVKIDVEGAEILFLRGATRLLENVRPILYIEVSEANSNLATEILSSFKYDTFTLEPDGSEKHVEKCAFNSIARPKERI
jgi:FkbM family methyltransferase